MLQPANMYAISRSGLQVLLPVLLRHAGTDDREALSSEHRLICTIPSEGASTCSVTVMTRSITTIFMTFMTVAFVAAVGAQTPQDSPSKPDNSKVNQRDRNSGQATSDDQKMNEADRELTAKIRKAIMADKSLSTYAHNIKIISQNGQVTLKGPVRSDAEVKSVVGKATEAAGQNKVVNQLEVAR